MKGPRISPPVVTGPKTVHLLEQLIAEQQETNRLLRLFLERQERQAS